MADGFANLAGVAAPYVVTDADRAAIAAAISESFPSRPMASWSASRSWSCR